MYPKLETIREYREDCRTGDDMPDVSFDHKCIDALIDALVDEQREGSHLRNLACEAEIARLHAEIIVDNMVKYGGELTARAEKAKAALDAQAAEVAGLRAELAGRDRQLAEAWAEVLDLDAEICQHNFGSVGARYEKAIAKVREYHRLKLAELGLPPRVALVVGEPGAIAT